MKFEKIPKDAFVIKIEITAEEAREIQKDLKIYDTDYTFYTATKEFYKQLQTLTE